VYCEATPKLWLFLSGRQFVIDYFICATKGAAVEDSGTDLDVNQMQEASSVNEPTTSCIDSEKPQSSDCNPRELNVPGSAEAAENVSEANGAHSVNVDPELETNCEPLLPQLAASNQTEESTAVEVLSLAGNVLLDVPKKKKRQPLGGKKRSQKQNEEAEHMSAEAQEGTWEVSRRDESSEKNVVHIRRQHPATIPDMRQEIAACPAQETVPSQSQVLCETACDTEERHLTSAEGKDDTINEQVASDSQEPVEGIVNPEVFETRCTNADTPDDASATDAELFVSTNGTDVSGGWTTVVRPKRRKKVMESREGCRKSQRRISRRQEPDGSVDNVSSSTVTVEAKTSSSCIDAQNADNKSEPCLGSARQEVLRDQVTAAQTGVDVDVKTEPPAAVYDSAVCRTEASMASSNSSVLNRGSVTNAPVDNFPKSAASTEKLVVSEATAGLVDRQGMTDTSEDQSSSNSASDHSSCAGGIIQPMIHTLNNAGNSVLIKVENDTVKRESDSPNCILIKVENDTVKRESNSPSCSFLAVDFNTSSRPSNAASLLNTCLSETFLKTVVSPEEQVSRSSVVRSHASSGTSKETESSKDAETSSSVNAAVVKLPESCESESEEVCKTILAEVVASVVKEACLMSVSEENDRNVDSAVTSSRRVSQNATTQKESDGTTEEMPLKKRRGRHFFADRQPGDTVRASHRSGGDRRAGFSALASSQRRKMSSSSSRRHSPRGNKYVGAHTSVVGGLLWEFQLVIRCCDACHTA